MMPWNSMRRVKRGEKNFCVPGRLHGMIIRLLDSMRLAKRSTLGWLALRRAKMSLHRHATNSLVAACVAGPGAPAWFLERTEHRGCPAGSTGDSSRCAHSGAPPAGRAHGERDSSRDTRMGHRVRSGSLCCSLSRSRGESRDPCHSPQPRSWILRLSGRFLSGGSGS